VISKEDIKVGDRVRILPSAELNRIAKDCVGRTGRLTYIGQSSFGKDVSLNVLLDNDAGRGERLFFLRHIEKEPNGLDRVFEWLDKSSVRVSIPLPDLERVVS
jgi:hypothetical protein